MPPVIVCGSAPGEAARAVSKGFSSCRHGGRTSRGAWTIQAAVGDDEVGEAYRGFGRQACQDGKGVVPAVASENFGQETACRGGGFYCVGRDIQQGQGAERVDEDGAPVIREWLHICGCAR